MAVVRDCPANEPGPIERLDRARSARSDRERRGCVLRRRHATRRLPEPLGRLAERSHRHVRCERGDGDGPEPVKDAIEEDEEQKEPDHDERPASVTPRFGTKLLSTRRRSVSENTVVATSTARSAFSIRSRYHRRMYRAEKVPVAIWTTSTLTVMTKPVSPTSAPTIVASTVLAVEGEYCQICGNVMPRSTQMSAKARAEPRRPPSSGPHPQAPARVLAQREGAAPRHEPRHVQAHRRTRTAGSAPTLSRDKLRRTSSFVTSSTALMGM